MHLLYQQLQNPLTRERDVLDRARLVQLFPDLGSLGQPHFLALRRYLYGCPERFLDETAYRSYLDWLKKRDETDGCGLRDYLSGSAAEINRALLFLREINSEDWHDRPLRTTDEYDLVRLIDKHVHPTYLRLVEAVLHPLAKPIAYFIRRDAGKGTDGLDIWNVVQELAGGMANQIIRPYKHIIRNGIGHGAITFLQNDIRYNDKKGYEETFSASAVVRLCDDLLDTCNGLVAALKIFLIVSRERGYVSPRELLLEELKEETRTPWWTIEGCVESELGDRRQLIVYARPDSRDVQKVQWSTVQSGILAEFFAPGYDRYFFSLRSAKALPGWAAFDGKRLRELREAGIDDLSKYGGIIEDNLIFYIARPSMPRFIGRFDTLAHSFRIYWPLALQKLRQNLGIPHIVCRSAKAHRNSWGSVLNAEVVIEGLERETAMAVVRKYRRRILRTAIKESRRSAKGLNKAAYLPIGYAHISVFQRDYRLRRLSGFGLGKDLICTLRLQVIRRIESVDILGSTIETKGNWRIAWNKAWLEAGGH